MIGLFCLMIGLFCLRQRRSAGLAFPSLPSVPPNLYTIMEGQGRSVWGAMRASVLMVVCGCKHRPAPAIATAVATHSAIPVRAPPLGRRDLKVVGK
jgi:hypothetical protein